MPPKSRFGRTSPVSVRPLFVSIFQRPDFKPRQNPIARSKGYPCVRPLGQGPRFSPVARWRAWRWHNPRIIRPFAIQRRGAAAEPAPSGRADSHRMATPLLRALNGRKKAANCRLPCCRGGLTRVPGTAGACSARASSRAPARNGSHSRAGGRWNRCGTAGQPSCSGVKRSRRRAFSVTRTVAPVSAMMAIQRPVTPITDVTRNTALSPSAMATFW